MDLFLEIILIQNSGKKAKMISKLTKDITEYLDESIKLDFIESSKKKTYRIAYHSACFNATWTKSS